MTPKRVGAKSSMSRPTSCAQSSMSLETQPVPSVDLDELSERLPEVATRLQRWVLEAGDGDVALILKALDLQVRVSSEEVQIEGAVPLVDGDSNTDLVTIVQTSA